MPMFMNGSVCSVRRVAATGMYQTDLAREPQPRRPCHYCLTLYSNSSVLVLSSPASVIAFTNPTLGANHLILVSRMPAWTAFVVTFMAVNLPAGTVTVSGPDTLLASSALASSIPLPSQCQESPLARGFFKNCFTGLNSVSRSNDKSCSRSKSTDPFGFKYQSSVLTVSTR